MKAVYAIVAMVPACVMVISAAILQDRGVSGWGWYFGFGTFLFFMGFHLLDKCIGSDDDAEDEDDE